MDKQVNIEAALVFLDLRSDASYEEVRHAYHDMVRVWHPDRFANDRHLHAKAAEKLKAINEAYLTLIKSLDSISPASAHAPFTSNPQRTTQSHPSSARNDSTLRGCVCGVLLTMQETRCFYCGRDFGGSNPTHNSKKKAADQQGAKRSVVYSLHREVAKKEVIGSILIVLVGLVMSYVSLFLDEEISDSMHYVVSGTFLVGIFYFLRSIWHFLCSLFYH